MPEVADDPLFDAADAEENPILVFAFAGDENTFRPTLAPAFDIRGCVGAATFMPLTSSEMQCLFYRLFRINVIAIKEEHKSLHAWKLIYF